ncbi:MAG TPA: UDP-N-acetylmuramoyl-L-alanine--D-glutamate ligase [Caldimonas sp.]|jgi:UDP-N-acetylmuramoylalanine--D-glutamate ligase|nr:UDP-N-acetylmuramoyl-L-alanine--D-glutamate ligase [Caldimonas sp.]HEX4233581.1 UDP-N-acetylmuramoyl-L-alanine--D-glutamate ligase [Caldimonas sp.]
MATSTALVLGLGDSGLAMARWLGRDGAAVRVWDSRSEPPRAAELRQHVAHAEIVGGDLTAASLADVDRVLKSPGLAPGDPRIAPFLAAARAAGVPVQGELDLFTAALATIRHDRDHAPKVIAVTGTNGKTTTTALTALLVERSGRRVAAAGNIGPTMLQTLADAIDGGPAETLLERLPEVWVLELSSFQLDGSEATGFDADAAALLNLSDDHLDWHGTFAAYGAAKARVFGERATIVVNRDDAAALALVPGPKTLPPTRKGRAPRVVARRVVSFGAGVPERPGDWGLAIENDMAWLARALDDDAGTGAHEVVLQHLMPADALRIRGRHNALNALAALALATAIGCPLAPMLHALREYRGEPHRVEHVARVGDVDAFDDSKGTNVGATVAALVGLGAERAPAKLVVILGGDGKGQDFAPLAGPLARHARAALTIGRDAGAIEQAIAGAGVPFERCATLEAAVDAAFARALPGDAVLLSPACASLDMFRNYAHRAEVFVAAVQARVDTPIEGDSA